MAYQTVYNYPTDITVSAVYNHSKDSFFLLCVCSCQFTGYRPIEQSTIIQGIRFFLHLVCNYRYRFQSFNGCDSAPLSMQLSVFWLLAYWTVYNQLKDMFLPILTMQLFVSRLLVSQLLAYQTVYNHLRDAILLHQICSCQFLDHKSIRHPIIIKCVFLALSLQ